MTGRRRDRTTPEGLAIDRDHAIEALREALHEAHEAGLKWFGVELAKHPTATAKCPVDPVAFGDHALATTLAFLAKLDDDRKIAIR